MPAMRAGEPPGQACYNDIGRGDAEATGRVEAGSTGNLKRLGLRGDIHNVVVLGNGNRRAIVDSPGNAVDLLEEFKLTGRQDAFEEVVRRYAAMVFGVCLQTTRNAHDAEDATQAVFLSLATHCKTNGQSIRYVGPWLQKVARRVSLDIRRSKKRRQAREETHSTNKGYGNGNGNGNGNGHVEGGQNGVDVDELKVVLNEELHQLPAKYRLPMILHYYGGLSRDEMAKELGCKPSTLGVRIHRGRQMLAQRLTERGASPGHLSLGMALTLAVRDSVSDGMIVSTSRAAAELMAGNPLGPMISAQVLAFSHGAAGLAMIAKLKAVAAVVVVAALTLAGAAGAVAKVAPLENLKLQWPLKLQGIFRMPRLQSPFRVPVAKAAVPEDETDAFEVATRSAATGLRAQTVMWMGGTPILDDDDGRPNIRPGGVPSQNRRGGSAIRMPGMMVARFVSTVVGTRVSPRNPSSPVEPVGVLATGAPVDATFLATGTAGPVPVNVAPPANRGHAVGVGGVAIAHGSVTFGGDKAIYPLVPPSRRNEGLLPGRPAAGAPIVTPRGPVLAQGPSMTVGGPAGSFGAVTLERGVMSVPTQMIGERGRGELTQNGGTNIAQNVRLGAEAGGQGVYTLNDNQLLIGGDEPLTLADGTPAAGPLHSGIEIGRNGDGLFNIGNSLGGGDVSEVGLYGPIGGSLVVRGGEIGSGTLLGSGSIRLRGFLDHNGRMIADGYGRDTTLEISGFRYVGNSFDNPTAGGTNGWFARDHGKLVLPNLRVKRGTGAYTWGEDPTDPTIDLVNSVRLTIQDAAKDGPARISLLSTDRFDVPALPEGHTFIGVWQFENGGLEHGVVELLVRYDDALAAQLGLDENVLKLWRYSDGEWTRINDASFTLDTDLNLIGGTAGALEFFAVSAPEPSAAALLLVGGVALLRRRRAAGR